MRCKRHTVDFSSSTNGVCASCLRERLLSLAASAAVTAAIEDNNHNQSRKSNNPPPLLIFPRSVSPYVTRRKSDAGAGGDPLTSSNRRFITTPQVDLAGYSCKDFESNRSHNKPKENKKNSSRFSNLFRARSEDFDSNPKSNNHRFSSDASESSSSSSRSWISTILSTGRRKKQPCYIEDVIAGRRPQRIYCRGMSPARDTTEAEPSSESLEELRSTPATTKTPGRRKVGNGIGKKSMSGMAFCLSPLVRASPNCPFKRRMRFPSEVGNSGEVSTEQEKPHISAAASFCANRSKKLVDLGRVDRRR
ncbi:PREDICTED: uncharacterized protein LOC104749318 [Camelina sativa]|uniref:Uncharacterized protein LOC104749317 n=1 Tax=Camelina sativa TaxID=90675 RepID=A0ABM0WCS8_CAMSA|nr:PREDICTED: uncharacterized protein LOC104749317 [Camelina sativa]XP_010469218.1 PREDICTED: uncharacterized protein LOC104749318 [Camelina sativa]